MGWVTLTLRKTELKRSHSDYQMRLLQISREKRQMARQKHYEQTLIRNDQNADLRLARDNSAIASDSYPERSNTLAILLIFGITTLLISL
jgi:hypothetical protein